LPPAGQGETPLAYLHRLRIDAARHLLENRRSEPMMPKPQATAALTAASLVAFASNSVLCRVALRHGLVDAAAFTFIRLVSGAAVLGLILAATGAGKRPAGNWKSAAALFAYAAPFSFAYLRLAAGTGALILFGVVQATMIGRDLARGARPGPFEIAGLVLAIAGLVALTAPGLSAPDPLGALLMAIAGMAWGAYSLLGRGVKDPLAATTGNFLRAVVFAVVCLLVARPEWHVEPRGAALAVASGALASGVGYAVWYAALRGLTATRAAIVQLLVPVLAASAGALVLGEEVSLRLIASAAAIFAGVALAMLAPRGDRSGFRLLRK
jgi:drug/metabolite transporter (DMT)-like permease